MSNCLKKFSVAIFVLALAVVGVGFMSTDSVYAEESSASVSYEVQAYSGAQVSEYKSANKAPKPATGDGIFAGWFCDEACKTALTGAVVDTDMYYAKYVPAEVLSVKCQVKENTTADTSKSDMRLVSTVDSLDYKNVGFEIYFNDATTPVVVETAKVYERIVAASDGVAYEFGPKIFDAKAEYFVTATLINISNSNFDKGFFIKPYWETLDGTTVYGVERYARVEDSYLNIVNVPVRLYSDTVVAAGGVVVDYDETNFTYVSEGYGTNATAAYTNGDVFETVTAMTDNGDGTLTYFGETATTKAADGTLVHLRFQMSDPTAVPKINTFTIASEQFANDAVVTIDVSDVIYKNFNGGNTGVADTSWYDADEEEFVLTSEDEMLGFSSKAQETNFSGKTVYLAADIELNTGDAKDWATTAPENSWNPIGYYNGAGTQFAGTFDGQGHTISGVYVEGSNNLGFFGKLATDATLKNFRLENSYLCSTSDKTGGVNIGAIAASGCGSFENIYTNAIVTSYGGGIGGFIGNINNAGTAKMTNCWFDGTINAEGSSYNVGGFVGDMNGASYLLEMDNCLYTGDLNYNSTGTTLRIGGIIGTLRNGSQATMVDCMSAGTIVNGPSSKCGSVVGSLENIATSKLTIEAGNTVYATTDCHAKAIGNDQAVTGTGSIVQIAEADTYDFGAYAQAPDLEFYDDYTGKSQIGAWVARNNDTPALKTFVSTGIFCKPNTTWYEEPVRTEADGTKVYLIDTVAEFYGFASLAQTEDFAGEKIELGADISINKGESTEWSVRTPQNQWISIGYHNPGSGNVGQQFAGTFDGKGYNISGVYVNATANIGMFGKLAASAELKNFSLKNSYIGSVSTHTGTTFIGAIAGSGCGDFESIYTDAIVQGHGAGIGGFIGTLNNAGTANMSNCWFDGTVNVAGKGGNAGGFVGDINGATYALRMNNCLSTGTVNFSSTDTTYRIGGIVGAVRQGAQVTMEDCFSGGSIVNGPSSKCGSVIGSLENVATSDVNIENGSDVYATTECHAKAIGNDQTTTGEGAIVQVAKANTYSFGAFTALADLSFYGDVTTDGTWMARVGKTPVLRTFAEETGYLYNADTTWYDAAVRTEEDGTKVYVIDSVEDFYGFASLSATNSFAGEKIELATDIVINQGNAADWAAIAPEFTWLPIGFYNGGGTQFAGTFDGKTHTISGAYVEGQNNLGFFGKLATTAVLKNFSLVNSYIYSTSDRNGVAVNIGAIAGSGCGTFDSIYTDAIVQSSGGGIGGFLGNSNSAGTTKITNCWFDGTINMVGKSFNCGGFIGDMNGSSYMAEITNCLYTGTINFNSTDTTYRVGGMIGGVRNGAQVTLSDSVSAGKINSTNKSKTGTVVGSLENVTTSKVTVATGNTVYSTSECYDEAIGNTQATTGDGEIVHKSKSNFYSTKASDLDFDMYWKPIANSTPVLKCFEIDKRWYNTTDTEFVIDTVAEFYGFAELALSNSFEGQTVKLGADITVNEGNAADWAEAAPEKVWKPIAWAAGLGTPFAGTFDGQGHTISGIYISSNNNLGLFGKVAATGKLTDFRLVNSYITTEDGKTGNAFVGSIAGSGSGTFEKIYSNAIVNCSGNGVGGLIGCLNVAGAEPIISNCWFDGRVQLVGTGYYAGGFAGCAGFSTTTGGSPVAVSLTLSNCLFSGSVDYNSQGEYTRVGGFIGTVLGGASVELSESLSVGTVTTVSSSAQQAAFVGHIGTTSSVTVPENGDIYTGDDCYKSKFGFTNDNLTGEEYTHELDSKKDLYGYGAYLYTTSLDFDNTYANAAGSGSWVLREGTYPIPVCFESAEDVRVDLSCFVLEGAEEPAAMVDYGDGNYVITVTETEKTYYDAYISKLVDMGFAKHSDNGETGLDNGAVYTAIYQKDTLSLTLTYVTNTKTTYISAAANQAVSSHLIDTVAEDGGDATEEAMSLTMLALEEPAGGNFIMQLENGHFVLYDMAQTKGDYANMLAYMKTLTGGEKPVIDALIISHAHVDHYGILRHMDSDGNGVADDVFVQGVYYSMPSEATFATTSNPVEHMSNIETNVKKLRMTDGETKPEVYRIQTGQKYYFDGLSMEVMFTQEQLSGYTDFNETSSWCMFTIGTEKVLMGADASQLSMSAVMSMYSADYLYSDVFAGLHHGVNTWNDFTNYCATNTIQNGKAVDDVVLYSRMGDPTDSSSYTTDDLGDLLDAYLVSSYVKTLNNAVNKGVDENNHFYYGQGTIKLSFTASGITSEIITSITTE